MNLPITIRKATLDDLDFIEKCAQSLFEIEKMFDPYVTYNKGQYQDKDIDSIQNPDALVLILETDQPSAYLYAYKTFEKEGFHGHHVMMVKEMT